jgi:hypothetical protein
VKEQGVSRVKLFAIAAAALAIAASASYAAGSGPLGVLGSAAKQPVAVYQGLYDGHMDSYVITDVSSKSQAAALHINYSAALAGVKGLPLQYFIKGPAAKGQVSVFGSEPGETDYNPLWAEAWVTWKSGVTPTLLTSDNAILAMQKAGKLTLTKTTIVLNAPILHVGGK